MKRVILSIIAAIVPLCIGAQDLSIAKAQLDAMFSGIQKDSVKTGFLWDIAVNTLEGSDFSGTALTDSNYVDIARLYDWAQDCLQGMNEFEGND
ncbi:MAG: hypothetical protein IKX20_08570 [Paludibacteraceae bacterium]|nr:hypothetical protein [Paludibacteraceae bacterium]